MLNMQKLKWIRCHYGDLTLVHFLDTPPTRRQALVSCLPVVMLLTRARVMSGLEKAMLSLGLCLPTWSPLEPIPRHHDARRPQSSRKGTDWHPRPWPVSKTGQVNGWPFKKKSPPPARPKAGARAKWEPQWAKTSSSFQGGKWEVSLRFPTSLREAGLQLWPSVWSLLAVALHFVSAKGTTCEPGNMVLWTRGIAEQAATMLPSYAKGFDFIYFELPVL
jgi:hypothetical protein